MPWHYISDKQLNLTVINTLTLTHRLTHLVIWLRIQGSDFQEVKRGFHLLSWIHSTEESLVGRAEEKRDILQHNNEWARKKYLCGNLWRQEIKAPCCENLKKRTRGERSQTQSERRWQEQGKTRCWEKLIPRVLLEEERGKWRSVSLYWSSPKPTVSQRK